MAHNDGVTAYQASSVAYGGSCTSETRICTNGTLDGSYTFDSCSVASAANCSFNGNTVNHGSNVTAYQASSVAFGGSCVSESRSCSNGTLSGNYTHASCTVAAAANCSFNGNTVNHSSSVTAYQAATVPFGNSCVSENRTCTNGSLSGSYTYASCTVDSAPSANCTFDGDTVSHGASVTAYQAPVVDAGTSCNSETRTCNNGTLSGSFNYDACNVRGANCPSPLQ